jgi:hypothetical protein
MILNLSWSEMALRLALKVAVGVVIGYNRRQHGKAAGMSTSVLVCLAASVAMTQVNLLLPTAGRPPTLAQRACESLWIGPPPAWRVTVGSEQDRRLSSQWQAIDANLSGWISIP